MPENAALGPPTAVVVPIRSFTGALSRLRSVLNPQQRRQLMMLMAGRVIAAADSLAVYVASDDAEVAEWAQQRSTEIVRVRRPGLSTAVTAAAKRVASDGFERVVVAHADLALAHSLRPAIGSGLTIVPDRHGDGTNVMCVPSSAGFCFSYGVGSFSRHVAHARELGLAVDVVNDARLAVDIDHPEDLPALQAADRLALGLDSASDHPSGQSRRAVQDAAAHR